MSIAISFPTFDAVNRTPIGALEERILGLSTCPPTPRDRQASGLHEVRRTEGHARHSNQIAGGNNILRDGEHVFYGDIRTLAETAHHLRPFETFLDLTAASPAELIGLRTHIPAEQPMIVSWRRMRHGLPTVESYNHVGQAVAAPCSDHGRREATMAQFTELLYETFRIRTGRKFDLEQHPKPGALPHRDVASEGELRFTTLTAWYPLATRIKRRSLHIVTASFAPEVRPDFTIVAVFHLRFKNESRRPRFDQRCIQQRVQLRRPDATLREPYRRREEGIRHFAPWHSLPAFQTRRFIERRLTAVQIKEPAAKQTLLRPVAELPLPPHRLGRQQQFRHQKPLWRGGRPTTHRTYFAEVRINLNLHLAQQAPERVDPMIHRSQRLHVFQIPHTHLELLCAIRARLAIPRSVGRPPKAKPSNSLRVRYPTITLS